MSYTDNTTREWRAENSTERRLTAGLFRRMAVKLTSGVFWQCLGHLLLDNATRETVNAEVFAGVGFYARPKAGHNAEAIVVYPGGTGNPVIIATRDEDARRAIAKLDEDETAAFNSSTIILIKKNGSVEIRSGSGAAHALATKQDLQDLKDAISHAVVVAMDGGASLKSTLLAALSSWPTGTTVLKAQ